MRRTDRQIDLLHLKLAYNIEPAQWKYSEIKIRCTLSQPFDKLREATTEVLSLAARRKVRTGSDGTNGIAEKAVSKLSNPFRMAHASSSARCVGSMPYLLGVKSGHQLRRGGGSRHDSQPMELPSVVGSSSVRFDVTSERQRPGTN
jgi:hypothetical protein